MIVHAVWLYSETARLARFGEDCGWKRGKIVSCDAILLDEEVGLLFASRSRRKPASSNDVWHPDEAAALIRERRSALGCFRQAGYVLDESMPSRRNAKSAKRLELDEGIWLVSR